MSVETNVETGLCAYLLADSGVAAIIGTKVNPAEAAQNQTEPFITYKLDSAEAPRFLNGTRRYEKFLYEIECCDVSYDAAMLLADAVLFSVGGDEGLSVTTTLGTAPNTADVIMFWNDPPVRKTHLSAQDQIRHQVSLYLMILIK